MCATITGVVLPARLADAAPSSGALAMENLGASQDRPPPLTQPQPPQSTQNRTPPPPEDGGRAGPQPRLSPVPAGASPAAPDLVADTAGALGVGTGRRRVVMAGPYHDLPSPRILGQRRPATATTATSADWRRLDSCCLAWGAQRCARGAVRPPPPPPPSPGPPPAASSRAPIVRVILPEGYSGAAGSAAPQPPLGPPPPGTMSARSYAVESVAPPSARCLEMPTAT